MEDHSEIEEVDCFDPSTGQFAHISDPNAENEILSEIQSGKISSGETTLMQEGAYFDEEEGSLVITDLENVQYEDGPKTRRKLASTTGTKEMLALRVIAPDASTTSTENQISDAWFGTHGDPVNLKSQYEACSYNKLQINPANTRNISNGVRTISIGNNVIGASSTTIQWSVVWTAWNEFGSLINNFDHVMLCLPPGTTRSQSGSWIAYAWVNSWLSVYNDQWCNYVSAQMHGKSKIMLILLPSFSFMTDSNSLLAFSDCYTTIRNIEIGHNLGLAHSGETATYDDQSGMVSTYQLPLFLLQPISKSQKQLNDINLKQMGHGYRSNNTPEMCFNAPKNWQLQWYTDRQRTVNAIIDDRFAGDDFFADGDDRIPPASGGWSGKIYGIADYGRTINGDTVIVKIVMVPAGATDWYVSFNRRAGINIGTQEGGDQVLVHKRTRGLGYAESDLMAKINAGDTYSGAPLEITVNAINLRSADPPFAYVKIGSGSIPTPQPGPPIPIPQTNV